MRILLTILITLLVLPFAAAQGYAPRAGETVLKLEIEGRGNVFILLYTQQAPKTTAQIIRLARSKFYDGQRFHRVERRPKPYLVQIGDPKSKTGDLSGAGGSGTTLPYEESGMKNERGAVGLAHAVNNRDAGDSQFYLLLDRSSFLDNNYTVFGKVVEGMEVLQKVERGDRLVSATIIGG